MAFRLLKRRESRLLSRSFQELYNTSEESVRRLFLKNISQFQNIVFTFTCNHPELKYLRYAANVVLRWKQVYAEEYTFQHRLLSVSTDRDVKELRRRIAALRTELSNKVQTADKGRNIAAIISDLNGAEDELRKKSKVIKSALLVTAADLDRVMGVLPKKSAVIEFRRFKPVDFKKAALEPLSWVAYLLISDMEAEQQIFFENLGSFEDLNKILKDSNNPSTAFYTMFIQKFEKHLKGVQTLYIAPDGFLNIIPFASLVNKDGKYLAQKYKIVQLQTGRDLIEKSKIKPSNTFVAFGGIDYGPVSGSTFEQKKSADSNSDIQKLLKLANPNIRAAKEFEAGFPYLTHSITSSRHQKISLYNS